MVTCRSDLRSQTGNGWVELRVRARGLIPSTAGHHRESRQAEELNVMKRKIVKKMPELISNWE